MFGFNHRIFNCANFFVCSTEKIVVLKFIIKNCKSTANLGIIVVFVCVLQIYGFVRRSANLNRLDGVLHGSEGDGRDVVSYSPQTVEEIQTQTHVAGPIPFLSPRFPMRPFQVELQLLLERSVIAGTGVCVWSDVEGYGPCVDCLSPDLLSQTIAPVGKPMT